MASVRTRAQGRHRILRSPVQTQRKADQHIVRGLRLSVQVLRSGHQIRTRERYSDPAGRRDASDADGGARGRATHSQPDWRRREHHRQVPCLSSQRHRRAAWCTASDCAEAGTHCLVGVGDTNNSLSMSFGERFAAEGSRLAPHPVKVEQNGCPVENARETGHPTNGCGLIRGRRFGAHRFPGRRRGPLPQKRCRNGAVG